MFSFLLPPIRPGSLGDAAPLTTARPGGEKLLCRHLRTDRVGLLSFGELDQPANRPSFPGILRVKTKSRTPEPERKTIGCVSTRSPFSRSLLAG